MRDQSQSNANLLTKLTHLGNIQSDALGLKGSVMNIPT